MTVDISSHPWMIYAALIVGIGLIVANGLPQFFGKVGETIDNWAKRQRAAAAHADDSDIADLIREKNYLAGVAAERLRELEARDRLIGIHMVWDRDRYNEALVHGYDIRPAPPLHPELGGEKSRSIDGHPT